jgi:hypothetical protein
MGRKICCFGERQLAAALSLRFPVSRILILNPELRTLN